MNPVNSLTPPAAPGAFVAFLAAHGPMLLLGATALLSGGAVALLLQRSPIHRQRIAEMTVLCVMVWAVLACVPLPRWSASGWVTVGERVGPAGLSDAEGRVSLPAVGAGDLPPGWESALSSLVRPVGPVPQRFHAPVAPGANVAAAAPPDRIGAAPATIAAPPPRTLRAAAGGVIVRAYLACATGCAAWLLLGQFLLWRVTRSARPPEAWLADLFDGACRAVGVCRGRLLVVPTAMRPVSCGVVWPTVLLGREDCSPHNRPRLRQVLLHEAAHLRQRDAWGNALLNLAMPLLYVHPLYWLLRSEASLAREMVADDIAAAGTSRSAYAAQLLDLARARSGYQAYRPVPLAALGIFHSRSHFFRRMHMLMHLMHRDSRLERRCSAGWKFASGAACVAALVVASATLGVRRAAGSADPTKPTESRPDTPDPKPDQPAATPAATPAGPTPPPAATPAPPPTAAEQDVNGGAHDRVIRRADLDKARAEAMDRIAARQLRNQLQQKDAEVAQLRAQLAQAQAELEQAAARARQAAATAQARAAGGTDLQAKAGAQGVQRTHDPRLWDTPEDPQATSDAKAVQQKVNVRIAMKIRDEGLKVKNVNALDDPIRQAYLDLAGREPTPADWNATKEFLVKYGVGQPPFQPEGDAGAAQKTATATAAGPTPVAASMAAAMAAPPTAAHQGESARLNAAVAGLRPQLDLVALANSYADAVANSAAAKVELAAVSPTDPAGRAAAEAKLAASQQKARLFRSITEAALQQAERETAIERKRVEVGNALPGDLIEAEGRVRILSLILQSDSGAASPGGHPSDRVGR